MNRGSQKACKEKNKLYRDYVEYGTKTAEMKYKVYKNKLTIMTQVKKDYYNVRLKENKGDRVAQPLKIINNWFIG